MPRSLRFLVVPLLLAMAGCVPIDTMPGNRQAEAGESQAATPSTDSGAPNNAPRLVIPATGGAPVVAIPLGGNLYLPVTGGPPVPGTPIGP
jgi:hypothetical protein